MPASAIAHVEVDHVLPAAEIGPLLARAAREPLPKGALAMHPAHHSDEPDVSEVGDVSLALGDLPEPPTGFTCPECGGALWELQSNKLLRFRCHVGHGYSPEGLISEQARALEGALWAALRSLEENAGLRRRLSRRARDGNWMALAEQYDQQAQESESRASVIRQVLLAEHVEGADLHADAKLPRPRYDGRLYGKHGRRGDPKKKVGEKSRTQTEPAGPAGAGKSGAAMKSSSKSHDSRKNGRARQGRNGKRK